MKTISRHRAGIARPRHRGLLLAAMLVLSACASSPPRDDAPVAPAAPVDAPAVGEYRILPGGEPETIAALRAATAVTEPEIIAGTEPEADALLLRAQGLLRIGIARVRADDPRADGWLRDQALRVGADAVRTYPPATTTPLDASFEDHDGKRRIAAYFVRIRPPFGAQFRDLTADERARLKVTGGVRLGDVIGGSPASQANLLPGDVVLRVAKVAVTGRGQFQALLREHAGRAVTLAVWRDGAAFARTVRLGALPGTLPP